MSAPQVEALTEMMVTADHLASQAVTAQGQGQLSADDARRVLSEASSLANNLQSLLTAARDSHLQGMMARAAREATKAQRGKP